MHREIKEYCCALELTGKSLRTVASYRQDLVNFARWAKETAGEGVGIEEITPLDLQEYRRHLMGRCRPATVNKALVVIKAFFRWAVEKGLVGQNPALALKPVRAARPAPRWLERKEQLRLLREVQKGGKKRDIALIALQLPALNAAELIGKDKEKALGSIWNIHYQ